ncbi:MAG TPA: sigma-70 family RNA polymerase sigma factor [Gemmataceae bacterium]|nr:sigma-70 family RNA polymerase sigma factor [Gemmataceae bacterium]
MSQRHFASDCAACGAHSATNVSDAELLERFVSCRDEAAFAALMARHGPMVFGVCRRLLRHAQDAEDAFQATFLILVRKAASIGKRELLGNWLYGVAIRVASRARVMAMKRRTQEATDMEQVAGATREPAEAPDLRAAITEEVQRLPAKYRGPVVLYYLEGRTNEEVAGELRCPVGTIKTRLSRAREMLRKRLTRRGLVLSTTALSAAMLAEASAASLQPALIDPTLKAAMSFAAGNVAAGGLVSAQAAELTKGVLHTMFVTKMKTLAALVLALTMIVGGTGVFAYHILATELDAKKMDTENIKGTWKVESATMNGQDPKDAKGERIKNPTFEITADKMLLKFKEGIREATYTFDPAAKPKRIDMTSQGEGDEKGETVPGIYKLEGDTLTICFSCARQTERPTEFVSKEGSDTILLILKRVKK